MGLGILLFAGCGKPKPLAKMEQITKHNRIERKKRKRSIDAQRRADGKLLAWELQELLRKSPNDVEVSYELADVYRNDGSFAKAADLYKLCSVYSPRNSHDLDPLLEQNLLERHENARYWEVFCRNKSTAGIHNTCDLAPLEDVMRLCDAFSRDYPSSQKSSNILEIKAHCRKRLLCKSQSVFDQYCNNWYSKEMNKRERSMAAGDRVAAQKVLEKMKNDFDVNDPDIASRIAFSEYKLARVGYKVAQVKKMELAGRQGKDVSLSVLEEFDKLEQDAKKDFVEQLALLTQGFADTKEAKAATAMAKGIVDPEELDFAVSGGSVLG
jgi:hypothetical protein